ncbi:MAG: NADH-quinone oxidoreductase subunit H, partial [Candidatus Nanoarchaeia archaeon]
MEKLSLTIFALFLAPLIPGIINRVKAIFAGRTGQPLFQTYYDIFKLLRKGATYSKSTTWIFRAAPVISIGALVLSIFMLPLGTFKPFFSFEGDIILFAYLLAISRFVVVLAALDTASSFEGMGASREVWFSAIAEPALFIALATLAKISHNLSLDFILNGTNSSTWLNFAPALCM